MYTSTTGIYGKTTIPVVGILKNMSLSPLFKSNMDKLDNALNMDIMINNDIYNIKYVKGGYHIGWNIYYYKITLNYILPSNYRSYILFPDLNPDNFLNYFSDMLPYSQKDVSTADACNINQDYINNQCYDKCEIGYTVDPNDPSVCSGLKSYDRVNSGIKPEC